MSVLKGFYALSNMQMSNRLKSYLKKIIKIFRRGFYNKIIINPEYNYKIITYEKSHLIAGYYDKTPISKSGKYIILLAINEKESKKARILCFDITKLSNPPKCLGDTEIWSWQLGSRLLWFKNDHKIGYNCIYKKKPSFIIKNFKTKKIINVIPLPIYDFNPTFSKAVTLDFGNLYRKRPGYGFDIKTHIKGILLYDIIKKKKKLLYSIEDARKRLPESFEKSSSHYFNHISWSKNPNFFIFFHLWIFQKKKYNQVLLYDIQNNKIEPITDYNEITSHYTWTKDDNLILTIERNKVINYYIINIITKKRTLLDFFPNNLDGHPTQNPINVNQFITDSYADYLEEQSLFLVDFKKKKLNKICKVFAPNEFTGKNKCDLHPRWSEDGKIICCDSNINGKREILLIKRNYV